jgi:5-methylcytosine-specific restriction endonuclease McrA
MRGNLPQPSLQSPPTVNSGLRRKKMPSLPSRLCRDCQSRAIEGSAYCARHQQDNNATRSRSLYDAYRADDPIRKLYRNKRWQATRQKVLSRDILCRSCGHRAATEVDHILSARLIVDNFGVQAFYDPARLQGLCHGCHSSKTAIESGFTGEKGTRLGDLGDRSNTTVITGPAGSGKSSYVEQHKQPNDHVFDYDVAMQQLTGLPMHEGMPDAAGSVLALRDQFIQRTQYSKHHVWLVIANRNSGIVKALEQAGARVIEMATPADECERRLTQRRKAEAQAQRPPVTPAPGGGHPAYHPSDTLPVSDSLSR